MSVPCVLLLHAKLFVLAQVLPQASHPPSPVTTPPQPALPPNSSNPTNNNNNNNNNKGRRPFFSLYNGRLVLWLRTSNFWHDSISKRLALVLDYLGGLLLFFDHPWPTEPRTEPDLPASSENETVPELVAEPAPVLEEVGTVPETEPVTEAEGRKVRCNPDPLGSQLLANYSLTNPFLMNDSIYGTPFSPAWTAMYRYFIPSPSPHKPKAEGQAPKRPYLNPNVSDVADSTPNNNSHPITDATETPAEASNETSPEHCVLYFYYHKACPYSAHVAPEINALPRLFPQVFVLAIDTKKYWNHSIKYGLMFVPNLVLLKGKGVVANFEGTMNTQNIITFITNHTDLQPVAREHVILEEDYTGPIPTQMVDTNPVTYLCWCFIGFVLLKYLISNRDRLKPRFHHLLNMVNRNHAHLHAD